MSRTIGTFLRWLVAVLSCSVCIESQTLAAPVETVTVYGAQGIDHNLPGVPKAILTGSVKWESSFFSALTFAYDGATLGERWSSLSDTPVASVGTAVEIIGAQHHGRQTNSELGVAGRLNSPRIAVDGVSTSFRFGLGLSHAFGTTSYEDGPFDHPDRRYRTQLLMLFDLQWKLRAAPRWSLVTRLHHRSGAYGLVAPRNVGSNFLAIGLQASFD